MTENLEIPADHWLEAGDVNPEYLARWEQYLRESVAATPDPAQRFGEWLEAHAIGRPWEKGVRCVFVEEPYLTWALAVDRLIADTEARLRKHIAWTIENHDAL